jgi:UDP-N-acetylmuramoyl-tripeptide--D-alanyl-D-alanine ligase
VPESPINRGRSSVLPVERSFENAVPSTPCAIQSQDTGYETAGGWSMLDIRLPAGEITVRLSIEGRHNARNALAAAAVATAMGVDARDIARGLAAFRPVKSRLQVKRAAGGCTILDDTYNANPDSVRAAIDVLAAYEGVRVLVLGDVTVYVGGNLNRHRRSPAAAVQGSRAARD